MKFKTKDLLKGTKTHFFIWAFLLLILVGGALAVPVWYAYELRPLATVQQPRYFTILPGSGLHNIAINLKEEGLIRSTQAFSLYVKTHARSHHLQAGTYSLSPSMGTKEIANKIAKGDVAKNLLTILPGKRLDEVKKAFAKAGYSEPDITLAFDPAQYAGHPVMAYVPNGSSLEGFLYPDSFQKEVNTPAQTIVKESLDEMQKHLSQEVIAGFKAHGLTTYEGVTLASIVSQETDDPSYQPTVAQVFLSRIGQGIKLQSNVTANYSADVRGVPRNINIDSLYNTYLHAGLPPGPIGGVTASSLKAVASPSNTDYLYFIAGDDNKVHFSHTSAEHEDAIKHYCQKKCAQP